MNDDYAHALEAYIRSLDDYYMTSHGLYGVAGGISIPLSLIRGAPAPVTDNVVDFTAYKAKRKAGEQE